MIEETLDRIAVALERVADLMDRSATEECFRVNEELSNTHGGLSPNAPEWPRPLVVQNYLPDQPAPINIGPAAPYPDVIIPLSTGPAHQPADDLNPMHFNTPYQGTPTGPAHHTGTFIAPPPPDADTMPGPGDPAEPDSAGHRWDARIHSAARTKVKNTGEWKLLRGVDKGLVAAVFAEQSVSPSYAESPATPGPAANPAAGPVTGQAPTLTMKDFVTKVTGAGYTIETMQPFLAGHGIAGLPFLTKSPELIPVILAEMGLM